MKRAIRGLSVLVAIIFLFACSGGGEDSDSPNPTAPKTATGIFTDGPVQGLSYVSGGQTGKTLADGSFTYEVGKTVRFYVGDVTIGEAEAKSVMTPVDLAKTITPTANASNRIVVNIARFLMSISTIDASTGKMTIDSSKVKGSASASDFNVSTSQFTTTLSSISSGTKYTEAQAKAHFSGVITKRESKTGTKTNDAYYNTYDTNGLMTKEEWDDDGNGTIDRVLYFTYDANGNNTRIDYDEDNNGSIDNTMSYTYDANGNITKRESKTGTKTNDAYYNTYDTNGLMTKEEWDDDGNGTIDRVLYFTYDANGNNTRIDYDEDNNGSIDNTMSYTYDANGNITKRESKTGTKTNDAYFNTYDTNGLMTKEEWDDDGNGTIDRVLYFTYDANGNNTRIDYDEDNNGSIDDSMYYTWEKI